MIGVLRRDTAILITSLTPTQMGVYIATTTPQRLTATGPQALLASAQAVDEVTAGSGAWLSRRLP
ncbi:hypothetical protein [Amycolatopsis sp. 195334CR]|uniref:hypothetical protein n=1 Tax=Amycolatopsis sp. 195334CR TaxID=2814588 RepID=UPI001A8DE2A6|nr:hypothetical protein [Amycolatopsis sp. 195334CR]MBN6034206.1 hypothetical protein [Amycolatopsis sp. 195334CR]